MFPNSCYSDVILILFLYLYTALDLAPGKQLKGKKQATRDLTIHETQTADIPDMFILIGADELQYILEVGGCILLEFSENSYYGPIQEKIS